MTETPLGPLGDLAPDDLRAQLHRMADWVADYRETIEQRAIVPTVQPGEIAAGLGGAMPAAPESMRRIIDDLDALVMPGIVHWGHPAFLGYFGSTSNGPALLGEIAAAALNVSAMTWRTSPAATEMETVVLAWIREMIGLPSTFMGIVYDTASIAVLHALAAAREVAAGNVRGRGLVGRGELPTMRVYASDQAHSSVEKAMVMLGLGENNVRRIPCDGAFRMDVARLKRAIEDDEGAGFRPMAIIATVGTTSTASVDRVAAVAEVARAHGAWLHVDAAYGGAMAVLPEGRHTMAGTEAADSVVVNPHKWLFVPLDFSVLFIRRPEVLRSVFALTPEYLRGDAAGGPPTDGRDNTPIDYMDYGIQLGRRFRALKAWMVFRAFGRDGIESRIREHCRLAALLASWVETTPPFVLTAPQSMGIVCFRAAPPSLDDERSDRLNEAVVERVNASGRAYLTHTRLQGRISMRVGIGNVLTTEVHLRQAWAAVREETSVSCQE